MCVQKSSPGCRPSITGSFQVAVSFPPGGPAHQLVNDGQQLFIYLAISVGLGVDMAEYPESGKISCATGRWPKLRTFVFKEKAQADYWEGED